MNTIDKDSKKFIKALKHNNIDTIAQLCSVEMLETFNEKHFKTLRRFNGVNLDILCLIYKFIKSNKLNSDEKFKNIISLLNVEIHELMKRSINNNNIVTFKRIITNFYFVDNGEMEDDDNLL